jgi:hypothetical protein
MGRVVDLCLLSSEGCQIQMDFESDKAPGLFRRFCLPLLLVIAIAVSFLGLLSQSGQVMDWPMDQSFVTRADLRLYQFPSGWVFHYPRFNWSGGVSASLLIGAYKLIVSPPAESLNWHAKGITTLLFLLSSYSLCVLFIRQWIFQALAFTVIASSALQFAEPSSDIIAASFFALFMISVRLGWPRLISSGLLVLFGVSKIQLLACSLGVGAVWYWWDFRQNRMRWQIPFWMFFWLFLLMAPGFKLYGIDMIRTVKGLRTFATSYILLFSPHQFSLGSEPAVASSLDWREVMRSVFPGARTITDVLLRYPKKYLDFLLVSGVFTLFSVLQTMGLMLIPFFQAWRLAAFPSSEKLSLRLLGAAACLSLLPPLLLRFISPRYLAVVFIPIVVLAAAASSASGSPKSLRITFVVCSVLTLLLNGLLFQERLIASPSMPFG